MVKVNKETTKENGYTIMEAILSLFIVSISIYMFTTISVSVGKADKLKDLKQSVMQNNIVVMEKIKGEAIEYTQVGLLGQRSTEKIGDYNVETAVICRAIGYKNSKGMLVGEMKYFPISGGSNIMNGGTGYSVECEGYKYLVIDKIVQKSGSNVIIEEQKASGKSSWAINTSYNTPYVRELKNDVTGVRITGTNGVEVYGARVESNINAVGNFESYGYYDNECRLVEVTICNTAKDASGNEIDMSNLEIKGYVYLAY